MSSSDSNPQSAIEAVQRTIASAFAGSLLVASARSIASVLGRYVRASFLYRWLTAEPDPEVVVIDLRETWTVGPILTVLDRVNSQLSRGLENSRVGTVTHAIAIGIRSRPLAALGLVVAAFGSIITVRTVLATGPEPTLRLVAGSVVILTGVVLTRDNRDWNALRDTKAVELLMRLLEPPTQPAEKNNEPDDAPQNAPTDGDQRPDADRLE